MKMKTSLVLTDIPFLAHGFFGREGGVSEGIYGSLNCGPGSGDNPNHVAENRKRAAEALGGNPQNLCTLYQVHGTSVIIVDEPWNDSRPQADAIVTDRPGIILGILAADCVPILFCDPENRVIGAAHAGWRPALGGITENTIQAMEQLGAKRENIRVAIGPSIAQKSYQVSEDFLKPFLAERSDNMQFFAPVQNGKSYFDLKAYLVTKLARSVVKVTNVLANDTCIEEDAFFSYRRKTLRGEEDYGRQLSAIMMKE